MKAFYLILTVFILMIFLIISNGAKVISFTSDAKEALEGLSFSSSEDFIGKTEFFSTKVLQDLNIVEFSIPHDKTEALQKSLDLLIVYAKEKSKIDFEATRSQLTNILSEISELEKIKFSGLF